jgi:ribosome-associated translation inhibitor RaiA
MMEVRVTTLHGSIPESLNDHAARLALRLERLGLRASTMTVNFEQVNGIRTVEARLSTAGAPPMVGKGTGPTYRNALNEAVDRIERQIKRTRERRRQGRRAIAARD